MAPISFLEGGVIAPVAAAGRSGWKGNTLARGLTPRVRILASLMGYGVTAFTIGWVLANRGLGADLAVWTRVGDEVRQGISPYHQVSALVLNFAYAPPWALAFGATSWLPGFPVLVFLLELACLRYIAGSWLRVGYLGLIPITGGELAAGQFNLVIGAGLAAAMRGNSRLAVVGALAKLSPVLAIREWRRPLAVLLVCLAVTLPVAGWWFDWLRELQYLSALSIGFPIPVTLRLAVGLVILAVWRSPRAGVLAAAVAVPSLTSYSVVLLYPLLSPVRTTSPAQKGASISN